MSTMSWRGSRSRCRRCGQVYDGSVFTCSSCDHQLEPVSPTRFSKCAICKRAFSSNADKLVLTPPPGRGEMVVCAICERDVHGRLEECVKPVDYSGEVVRLLQLAEQKLILSLSLDPGCETAKQSLASVRQSMSKLGIKSNPEVSTVGRTVRNPRDSRND